MSNPRRQHVTKSNIQRELYRRYIDQMDYEPTIDDTLSFSDSDRRDKEKIQPVGETRRRSSLSTRFASHMSEHWIEWVISAVIVVIMYLMVDSKIDLARIFTTLDTHKDSIGNLTTDVKSEGQKNQDQDLTLKEHSLRLSTVEQTLNKNKK